MNKVTMEWADYAVSQTEPYVQLRKELYELENKVPTYRHDTLHWSRAFEYPWAILNSSPEKEDVILNAGSGTDVLGFYLSRFGFTFNVDINPEVINEGVRRAQDRYPTLHFRVADIRHLPYVGEFFDKEYCISVIEHGEGQFNEYLEELLRVLRPGGVLMITVDVGNLALSEDAVREQFNMELPSKSQWTMAGVPSIEDQGHTEKYMRVLCIKIVKGEM